jgi:MFS family permease
MMAQEGITVAEGQGQGMGNGEQTGADRAPRAGSKLPIRVSFYYGWLIVGVSALGVFFSGPGQTYSNSVFIESYMQSLNMDRTSISSIYSLATLIAGFSLFGIGRLVDSYGRRTMLTLVALFLGAACMFNSLIQGPVMLFIGFFLIRLFGQGSMTMIPNTLVSQWFIKYRGRALSFASLGGLLGAAGFPLLTNSLIDAVGWQATWRILGLALLLIFVPIAFCFVRNRPEDVGLLPDGVVSEQSGGSNGVKLRMEHSWTLSEAIRTRSFWLLMICASIPAMLYTGTTFQLFSILGERQIDRTMTAFVLSFIPLVSFGCSLLSGFIVERVRVHRMIALTFLLNIGAPAVLLLADSKAAVWVFAISWGVAQGLMNIPMGVVWANYFGRQHLGSIQSVTTMATVIGSAFGPIPYGWAYDQFGNYQFILAISIGIWVLGAILAFLSPPPRFTQRS